MSSADVPSIVADLRAGKFVIIVDDEDRENEGDLIIAAEKITPEAVNFMSKYGRGLICLTLTREHCERLQIPLMVDETNIRLTTNFTVSIDARAGVTTGISAYDRAQTIRVAVNPDSRPDDIVQPGHIFPLMAQPGGVLTRAGHTEAGCDLARLADCGSTAVIVEILNDDGSMARREDIDKFAEQHQLKVGTVEDLIRYRVQHEKTVHTVNTMPISTEYGEFVLHTYVDTVNHVHHLALVRGMPQADKPTLVRVHIENTLCDLVKVKHRLYGWRFDDAVQRVAAEECGVVVLLRLPEHNRQMNLQTQMMIEKPEEDDEIAADHWTIGVGGQILQSLGVGKMRLLHQPKRFHALGGFGLSVEDYIAKE